MTLSLNTIKPKAKTSRKRLGRGDRSRYGDYCGRGQKGQKSRSGASGLKMLGLKSLVSQTPKKRGFQSGKPKNQTLSVEVINTNFQEGDTVTPEKLAELGLIAQKNKPVKILGEGELQVKKLTLQGVKASKSVAEQIEKQGGKIE